MYIYECIGAATNIAQRARDLFVYPPKRVSKTCKNVYTKRTKTCIQYVQKRVYNTYKTYTIRIHSAQQHVTCSCMPKNV